MGWAGSDQGGGGGGLKPLFSKLMIIHFGQNK